MAQRDLIPNPVNGLIIFNTDNNAFEYYYENTPTSSWVALKNDLSVKYTSTDTTTNLNTSTITPIPLFGTEDWNDNNTLFAIQNNTTLRITETGRYRITLNLCTNITNNGDQLQLGLYVNGIIKSAPISTHPGVFSVISGTLNFSDSIELNANDELSIRGESGIGGGIINMRIYNGVASNVLIEKIN